MQRALEIKEAVYKPEGSEVASTLSKLGVAQAHLPAAGDLDDDYLGHPTHATPAQPQRSTADGPNERDREPPGEDLTG